MKTKAVVTVSLVCIALLLLICQPADARILLYDGKLQLNGFVKETALVRTTMYDREAKYRDNAVDLLMTSGLLEGMYTFTERPDLTMRLFGGVKAWWEKAPEFDDKLSRYIPHRDRKDYMYPRSFDDDMLTEAYLDIIRGPLQVRIGKQIVIWGQLDIQRVADVVNPLNITRGSPGIDTWEEVKRGIWMIRTNYQTNLPGNINFEGIFNPGDYRNMQLPYEGTHYGPSHFSTNPFDPDSAFGIYHWLSQKWRRDAPGWNLKDNYEFGFRVQGYTFDIDWTFVYWNARDDGMVANPRRITPFTLQYITAGIISSATGRPINPPDWPGYRVWYFKRYQTIGGTAQTWVQSLANTVWRMEWFLEIDRPMNKATDGDSSAVYGWTRRNVFGAALQCSKRFDIPKFTQSRFATGAQTDVSLTYFWEKIFNHDRDLVTSDRYHYYKDSVTDQLIMFVQQNLFNQSLVFVFTGNYYLRVHKWMAVPCFSYVFPGIHWRFDLGYAAYGGARYNRKYVSHGSASKDSVIIRLRYEF